MPTQAGHGLGQVAEPSEHEALHQQNECKSNTYLVRLLAQVTFVSEYKRHALADLQLYVAEGPNKLFKRTHAPYGNRFSKQDVSGSFLDLCWPPKLNPEPVN